MKLLYRNMAILFCLTSASLLFSATEEQPFLFLPGLLEFTSEELEQMEQTCQEFFLDEKKLYHSRIKKKNHSQSATRTRPERRIKGWRKKLTGEKLQAALAEYQEAGRQSARDCRFRKKEHVEELQDIIEAKKLKAKRDEITIQQLRDENQALEKELENLQAQLEAKLQLKS